MRLLPPLVALAVSAAACGGTSTETTAPTSTETPTEATTEIVATDSDGSMRDVIAVVLGDRPGGIVAAHRSVGSEGAGELELAAVGMADATARPMTVDTPVRIGSVTKTFVATVVLQLVDEGLVDLDTPLSTYLPDTPVGGDVTIRQLLSHRSGIANYTELPTFIGDVTDDPSRVWTPDEILSWVEGVGGPEPGLLFAYSNTNYILLGQLIEKVDGRPAGDAIEARIAEPLGLTDTWLVAADRPDPADLAIGWSSLLAMEGAVSDAALDETSVVTSAWTAGAMVSTAADLVVFFEALGDGALTSDALLAEMTTFEEGSFYGLGLFLVGFAENQRGWGHGGSIPGSVSIVGHQPETGETVVVLVTNDAVDVNGAAASIIGA